MKFQLTRALLMLSVLGLNACSKISFGPGAVTPGQQAKDGGGGTTTVCQPGQTTTFKPTKFLFVVDQSGSNFDGPYEHPGMATDKDKNFRFSVINDFLQKHGSQSAMNWGFLSYNNDQVQGLINAGDGQHPIFGNQAAMASGLQTFLATQDVGDTPQRAAMQMAHDLIQKDMVGSTVAYQYRVALLTDGYPTDYCPGGAVQVSCPGQMLEAQIDTDVQNIVNLGAESVQVSTVYYGLPDSDASARLQRMAKVGGGQFIDTNVSKVINLDNVIQVPTQVCPGQ